MLHMHAFGSGVRIEAVAQKEKIALIGYHGWFWGSLVKCRSPPFVSSILQLALGVICYHVFFFFIFSEIVLFKIPTRYCFEIDFVFLKKKKKLFEEDCEAE